ncbi:hypothetical protein [Geothrix fuzhouensis]|uniref:hypothetical protein n=1 Tax=Geothrix fuzhouensis TaxID=2966451 RepID=UPI002149010D|nr:hypothetical protein [Geothrix fuzhouensis]
MSSEARIRELRQELAELRDPGPGIGHDLYLTLRQSLVNDLAEVGATPEPPPPPQSLTLRQIAATTMHRPTHPVKGTMTAPAVPETPMPKKTPQACLATKLARLARLQAEDRQIEVYKLTSDIRTYCKVNGLPVPVEAERKNRAQAQASVQPKASSEPMRLALKDAGIHVPGSPAEAEAMREDLSHRLAVTSPEVAARFRALRSQALDLLPSCEGLTPDEAKATEREIGLLAEVLTLGVRLAQAVA